MTVLSIIRIFLMATLIGAVAICIVSNYINR